MSINAVPRPDGSTVFEGEADTKPTSPKAPAYEGNVPTEGVTAYVSEEMQAAQPSEPGEATIGVRPDPPDGYGITATAYAASGRTLVSWALDCDGHVVRAGACSGPKFTLAVQRHVAAARPNAVFSIRVYDSAGDALLAEFQL